MPASRRSLSLRSLAPFASGSLMWLSDKIERMLASVKAAADFMSFAAGSKSESGMGSLTARADPDVVGDAV